MRTMIQMIGDGESATWIATIANSSIKYIFKGATIESQAGSVMLLGNAMRTGQHAVIEQIGEIFEIPETIAATDVEIAESLFVSSEELLYAARTVYTVRRAGAKLWEELEAAGEALMAVLL